MGSLSVCMLLLLLTGSISVSSGLDRIIGGDVVAPYSIKYQASLRTKNGYHYCGGALIQSQWVITAAHCRRDLSDMQVVLGAHDMKFILNVQIFNVSKTFTRHFSRITYDEDIMLVKLSRNATLNAIVQKAKLPEDTTPLPKGTECSVSGWGISHINYSSISRFLRAVGVQSVDCPHLYKILKWLTPSMFCAGSPDGGKDACWGDSGGPLICNNTLEGIVSWGIACGFKQYPGVYTKVRLFVNWIEEVIQMEKQSDLY